MGPWRTLTLRPLPDASGFEVLADGVPILPIPGEEIVLIREQIVRDVSDGGLR